MKWITVLLACGLFIGLDQFMVAKLSGMPYLNWWIWIFDGVLVLTLGIQIWRLKRDKISELNRNREVLHQSEKLAAVGELAAGIAHEIRNPLTSLRGFVQLSHENHPSAYTEIMLTEIDRIHTITSELLLLGKPKVMDFENKPIVPLIEAVLTLMNTQAILYNIQIVFDRQSESEDLNISCHETKIKQVLMNLLKNAMEAMPEGGTLKVQLDRKAQYVRLLIIDEGTGMSKEKLAKLGQAFYTTKENGTGLGLMICFSIIEQHQGTMLLESEKGVGTTVEIRLPISSQM